MRLRPRALKEEHLFHLLTQSILFGYWHTCPELQIHLLQARYVVLTLDNDYLNANGSEKIQEDVEVDAKQ
ncbi:hypothetical protein VNO77_19805 [Canavalia gladiata]|uniref:Uncharacterized protein n=1 Tax=Canavalia gladiata TaxID=3824 RepID=A0AAN9QKR6_CANGL